MSQGSKSPQASSPNKAGFGRKKLSLQVRGDFQFWPGNSSPANKHPNNGSTQIQDISRYKIKTQKELNHQFRKTKNRIGHIGQLQHKIFEG